MAGLVDGEVQGACGEEGCWWVESAVVEKGVEGQCEECREGGEEVGCLGYGDRGAFVHGEVR